MRAKKTIKRGCPLRRHRLALALIGALSLPAAPALAQNLPEGGAVVPGSGSATIGNTGNQMTITQTTRGAIINWSSFNIGSGYGGTFNQPGANGVTLNRVLGTLGSNIDGTLEKVDAASWRRRFEARLPRSPWN